MTTKTDKQKDPLTKVYVFYSVVIALCILAMVVFKLNIYAKAVLCTLVLLCFCIMRSIKNAILFPPDIDPDTMQKVRPLSESGSATEVADADAEEVEYVEAETVDDTTEETSTIPEGEP